MTKSRKNRHILLICTVLTALIVIFFPMLVEKPLVTFKKIHIDNSMFEKQLIKNISNLVQNDIQTPRIREKLRSVSYVQQQGLQIPQAWLLLAGNYETEKAAIAKLELLEAKQLNVFIQPKQLTGKMTYQVVIGPEINRNVINQLKQQLALDAAAIIPYQPA